MPDRQPEPWETNAAGPLLTLDRAQGVVEVWALGAERFAVKALGREQVVVGFSVARETAHALARGLE
jgi:hypothetical protein